MKYDPYMAENFMVRPSIFREREVEIKLYRMLSVITVLITSLQAFLTQDFFYITFCSVSIITLLWLDFREYDIPALSSQIAVMSLALGGLSYAELYLMINSDYAIQMFGTTQLAIRNAVVALLGVLYYIRILLTFMNEEAGRTDYSTLKCHSSLGQGVVEGYMINLQMRSPEVYIHFAGNESPQDLDYYGKTKDQDIPKPLISSLIRYISIPLFTFVACFFIGLIIMFGIQASISGYSIVNSEYFEFPVLHVVSLIMLFGFSIFFIYWIILYYYDWQLQRDSITTSMSQLTDARNEMKLPKTEQTQYISNEATRTNPEDQVEDSEKSKVGGIWD